MRDRITNPEVKKYDLLNEKVSDTIKILMMKGSIEHMRRMRS